MSESSAVDKIISEHDKTHGEIEAWVDKSMYFAEAVEKVDGLVKPKVHLLEMSPDPLGSVAAMSEMYKGSVIRSRQDITDEMRREHFQAMLDTHLTAPLENIKFHFLIEGVDRSFTHQLVRIRTANFAQESLRFAVKNDMAEESVLPPSLEELPPHHPTRQIVRKDLKSTQDLYNYLIANGVPAEDARAYMPHAVATRIHFMVDMRNLIHHAGNRLCTQAQFVWRDVFTQMKEEIRNYTPDFSWVREPMEEEIIEQDWDRTFRWQFEAIANAPWWKPACYQQGHCPFQASFDRGCTIRDRVELNSKVGRKSAYWGTEAERFDPDSGKPVHIPAIRDEEWALDRTAAWQ